MTRSIFGRTRLTTAVRGLAAAGIAAALVGVGAPTAAAARTWYVTPGPNAIQKAVNRAAPGDTIRIAAGTYKEAVCAVGKGLTIQGAGAGRTVITTPGYVSKVCWQYNSRDFAGLFFLNPNGKVTVSDLTTRGHSGPGIAASYAKYGFVVTRTSGSGHLYGIYAVNRSSGIVITDNVETGIPGAPDTSTAGISVGDTPNANAVIARNRTTGYNLGIFVREARTGLIASNTMTNHCVGVLVFDDVATETLPGYPNGQVDYRGGAWAVTGNSSTKNNRFCRAGRDGSLLVSGVGMAVINADHVAFLKNTITDNHAVSGRSFYTNPPTLNFPNAGLVIWSFEAPGNPGDPGKAEYITVLGNTILRNDVDVFRANTGPGIHIFGNRCRTSVPPGLCA